MELDVPAFCGAILREISSTVMGDSEKETRVL